MIGKRADEAESHRADEGDAVKDLSDITFGFFARADARDVRAVLLEVIRKLSGSISISA
jgi:hypothetical protein